MQFISIFAAFKFSKMPAPKISIKLSFLHTEIGSTRPIFFVYQKKNQKKTTAKIKIDFVKWFFSFIDISFGDRPKLATCISTNRRFCLILKIAGCVPFSKSRDFSYSKICGFV